MTLTLKSFSTLQLALTVSILLHAIVLVIRFVDPEGFHRAFQDTTLNVVLVNARSEERPEKPQAIAQVDLAGGGDSEDKNRMTSSPLPRSEEEANGDAQMMSIQRQTTAQQRQQQQMLAQIKSQLASLPPPDRRRSEDDPQAQEQETQRMLLSKRLAVIERRIQEENSRPRKLFLSPATLGSTFALYYDNMRHKIEQRGTQNFPQVAGRKLYGELIMSLLINYDGRVLDATVVQTSGDRALDRFSEAIARSAGPFGPFTVSMRRETDQFDVSARFRFTHEQTLITTLQADAFDSGSAPPANETSEDSAP
jgi:protein TonB